MQFAGRDNDHDFAAIRFASLPCHFCVTTSSVAVWLACKMAAVGVPAAGGPTSCELAARAADGPVEVAVGGDVARQGVPMGSDAAAPQVPRPSHQPAAAGTFEGWLLRPLCIAALTISALDSMMGKDAELLTSPDDRGDDDTRRHRG